MKLTTVSGKKIFPIGAGTWNVGDNSKKRSEEIAALQAGINHGLNLIDTAEMYGNGLSENLVGEAIKNFSRDELFLVSKVLPENASLKGIEKSLGASLKRLQTDYLDLYLLHWKSSHPLEETIQGLEAAKKSGKIRSWGVSNFDTADLQKMLRLPAGKNSVTNQIKYNLIDRGAEFDLLPFMAQNEMALMAYSPIFKGKLSAFTTQQTETLKKIADNHGVTVAQIMLAWSIRMPNAIAIPKASSQVHMLENVQSAKIVLTEAELQAIDAAFPPPTAKQSLALW